MIEINRRLYKLCLFDTNALSSFLLKPKEWINYYNDEFSLSNVIICYSIFTLSELFYRQELFEKFLDIFSIFPSVILDGNESIFNKEIQNYFTCDKIDPIVLVPFSIQGEKLTSKETLTKVLKESVFISKTEYWKKEQKDVLTRIIKLKKNYPPKHQNYTIKEIEEFNLVVSNQQIGIRDKHFARKILSAGKVNDLRKFPSLKCTSYFVFYKFYPDNRIPIVSDVFDIMISALLPYVDYFISEGNMCEIIKRIQKKHNFLNNLESHSIKEIKKNKKPHIIE